MKSKGCVTLLLCVFLAGLFPVAGFSQETGDAYPRIIIITLNGVRNSESIDDPDYRFMPNVFLNLSHEGVIYRDVRRNGVAIHMDVDQAMLTGESYTTIAGLTKPSLFQLVRKAYGLSRDQVWGMGYWRGRYAKGVSEDYGEDTFPGSFPIREHTQENIKVVKEFLDPAAQSFLAGQEAFIAYGLSKWPIWDSLNKVESDIFSKILNNKKPVLAHFIMGATDMAHCNTFATYALALKGCDRTVKEVFDIIQTNPYYKGNTFLIVFPDHGRNAYYQHHNASFNDQESSWMFIYGPGIKKDVIIDRSVDVMDLYPTILNIMGISAAGQDRKPLSDCFADQS